MKVHNKAVFTLHAILNGVSDILVVLHDEDGDWQFLNSEFIKEDDAAIVSYDQILKLDNSIIEVINLSKGEMAIRSTKYHKWIRKKI